MKIYITNVKRGIWDLNNVNTWYLFSCSRPSFLCREGWFLCWVQCQWTFVNTPSRIISSSQHPSENPGQQAVTATNIWHLERERDCWYKCHPKHAPTIDRKDIFSSNEGGSSSAETVAQDEMAECASSLRHKWRKRIHPSLQIPITIVQTLTLLSYFCRHRQGIGWPCSF